MKVARLAAPGGLENIVVADGAAPSSAPGPNEIRLRVRASSLNYHDYLVATRPDRLADGRILLSDAAGTVEEVGADVTEFSVGDSVVSCFFPDWQDGHVMPSDFKRVPGDGVDGYAATQVTVPASFVTHSPSGWSHEEAATITTAGTTAWRALVVNGGLKAGDTVVALGTGGVSIFALQIAKAMGARVIVTSSSDDKLDRARAYGADATINYRRTPEWAAQVRALTDDRGANHVVEVGGPGTLPQSIAATAVGGHIALIGVLTGGSGDIPTSLLMARQQRLQGLIVGSRRQQKDFVTAVNSMGFRPAIDSRFDLCELASAFSHMGEAKHFGKVCITI